MLYLEEIVKRMSWRVLFPTRLDPVKTETIHRASGSRILLKIEKAPDDNNALNVTVTNLKTCSNKLIWEETNRVDLSNMDLELGTLGLTNFATLQYCLNICVRRMCAKHDVKEE